MAYVCKECGRTGKLPDSCCGSPMVSQGSYSCKSCGSTQRTANDCCGKPMARN